MKNNSSETLFVYGTLRKSFNNEKLRSVLKDLKYLGKAVTKGVMIDLGEYPAIISSRDADSRVKGEVYEVIKPERVFRVLDKYEGYDQSNPQDSEYARKKQIVQLDSGQKRKSWIYIYNRLDSSRFPRINKGDYLKYVKVK